MQEVWFVPVSAAAKVLRVSRQRVYQLISSGHLASRKVDSTVLVSMRSLRDRFNAQNGGDGRGKARRRGVGSAGRGA